MSNIFNILKSAVNLMAIIFLATILAFNIKNIYISKNIILWTVMFCIMMLFIIIMKGKIQIGKNFLYLYFPLFLLVIGGLLRIYLIYSLNFEPKSDFALYYNTATSLFNDSHIDRSLFISYNPYVYMYSSLIALVFKFFGASVKSVLIFHFICQVFTVIVIKKLVELWSVNCNWLVASLWFIFPATVYTNLIISTECVFMLLFAISLYMYTRLKFFTYGKIQRIIGYIFLGIMIAITNAIRPVMLIFIIAAVIDGILNLKEDRKLIFLIALAIPIFFLGNSLENSYVEDGLKEPVKKGALEWSIMYGANEESYGYWTDSDGQYVLERIKEDNADKDFLNIALTRYKTMGIKRSGVFLLKKFESLWTNTGGMYEFLAYTSVNDDRLVKISPLVSIIDRISFMVVEFLAMLVLIFDKNVRNKSLFFQIFSIGYFLANMIVCVNGRYSYPMILILFVFVSYGIDKFIAKSTK